MLTVHSKLKSNAAKSEPMQRQCVEACPNEGFLKIGGHQCIQVLGFAAEVLQKGRIESFGSILTKALNSLSQCWGEIVGIGLLAFLFSSFVVVLIRIAAKLVVLTVIFGTLSGQLAFGSWLAYKAATTKAHEWQVAYGFGAFMVIVITVFLTLAIFAVRKKIPMVIGIFKEASTALADIPSVIAVPILVTRTRSLLSLFTKKKSQTIAAASLAVGFFLYFFLVIESSGTYVAEGYFKKPFFTAVIRFINNFTYIWMMLFIFSCQDFVIAGSVATWYYSRMKSRLGFPALKSYYNLVRYHLGSLSLGALILSAIRSLQSAVGSEDVSKSKAF